MSSFEAQRAKAVQRGMNGFSQGRGIESRDGKVRRWIVCIDMGFRSLFEEDGVAEFDCIC